MSERIALSLGGKVVKYAIVRMGHQELLVHQHCPKCGHKVQLVAEVMQYGFWEDVHWYFVVCEKCAAATCFKQALVLDWEVKNNE